MGKCLPAIGLAAFACLAIGVSPAGAASNQFVYNSLPAEGSCKGRRSALRRISSTGRKRLWVAALIAAAAPSLAIANPASAAPTTTCTTTLCAGFYEFLGPIPGKTFIPISGTKHLIIPFAGHTNNGLVTVSTATTGAARLPFPLNVYGGQYNLVRVGANGNLQFCGTTTCGDGTGINDPVPSLDFPNDNPALLVFWDDLFFIPSDNGHSYREGVFTRTRGTAPNQTFIISWQGHAYNSEQYTVLAEAIFTEGSATIKFRYGAPDDQGPFAPSETIGAQFTQSDDYQGFTFDPAPPNGAVHAGTQVTLIHCPASGGPPICGT